MNKLKLLKNYQLIFALVMIVFIPSALLLHNYFTVQTVKRNMNTEYVNKASLTTNVTKNYIMAAWPDENEMQRRVEKVGAQNEEIIALDVLVPKKDNFKIQNSIKRQNAGEILENTLNNIAWKEEFITFTTNASAPTSDQSLTRKDYEENKRYQMVVKTLKNSDGEKVGLLSLKISLEEVDNLTESLVFRSYFVTAVLILVILLLVMSNFRLFRYAARFQQLKEVDEMKDEFISIASHELRAPLTSIKGYADIAREQIEKKRTKGVKKHLEAVTTSAKRLGDLVEDMLDVSRIEQNRIELDMKKINVAQIVDDVVNQFSIQAKGKDLDISMELNGLDEKDAVIKADYDRFSQVIVNMVSNAIKYTREGEVKIKLAKEDGGKRILVKVKDTGVGMNAKEREKLFTKFYRVKTDQTKKVTGTGLGLWITKQLVELMGGEIWVDSIKGEGTEFTVAMKLAKD